MMTTVRHEMGQNIGGACGQLALNAGKGASGDGARGANQDGKASSAPEVTDIEELLQKKTKGSVATTERVETSSSGTTRKLRASAPTTVAKLAKNHTRERFRLLGVVLVSCLLVVFGSQFLYRS